MGSNKCQFGLSLPEFRGFRVEWTPRFEPESLIASHKINRTKTLHFHDWFG